MHPRGFIYMWVVQGYKTELKQRTWSTGDILYTSPGFQGQVDYNHLYNRYPPMVPGDVTRMSPDDHKPRKSELHWPGTCYSFIVRGQGASCCSLGTVRPKPVIFYNPVYRRHYPMNRPNQCLRTSTYVGTLQQPGFQTIIPIRPLNEKSDHVTKNRV